MVHNNAEGRDAEILAAFDEPSWNNPVVRILDADKKDLVPRLAKDWSRGALLERIVRALETAERPVPIWLRGFAEEEAAHTRGLETAIFGMT